MPALFPELKNPTPRQIAVASAAYTTVGFGLTWLLIWLWQQESPSWPLTGITMLLVFGWSYFVFVNFLKRYIYRKIKLIYKTIHKHKMSPAQKQSAINIDTPIIEEVEKEVAQWADEQAREIAELKKWQEYRRRYIGDVSHELKTPIFNIQGYLETLLDGGLEDPAINRDFLSRAAKNVERLLTIVEDLEAISRLESGEMILDMQVFDIRTLVEEVFDEMEMKARQRNIRLMFKEGASQHFQVRADRESIRQVLINLISNSIKYGKEGGHTKVALYDMESLVLVEVADDGIGIPPEHINHVFDRFYRVDKSRSRERGGSGLGLSIVKHIIEAHHQTINVRSSVGMGSTFGFTLAKA